MESEGRSGIEKQTNEQNPNKQTNETKKPQPNKQQTLKQLKSLKRVNRNSGIGQVEGTMTKWDQNSGCSPQTNRILILRCWRNITETISALRNRKSVCRAELWPMEGISDAYADSTTAKNGDSHLADSSTRMSINI